MNTVRFIFKAILVYSASTLSSAKPFSSEDKNFSEDKLRCMDSTETSDYGKSYQNSYSDFYNNKPRPRFEDSEKYINRPFDADKRSVVDDIFDQDSASPVEKRQVGVVYKDESPIGILQPFQRSYRFIPVKEEPYNNFNENQDFSLNIPHIGVGKREAKDLRNFDESYASILTNFKIGSKLDKKRNYDAFTDENVQNLKSTVRRLRSSNSQNTDQIEEKLKNILDDMGLIDDDEAHAEKREVSEDPKEEEDETLSDEDAKSASAERRRRDESCISDDSADLTEGSEYKTKQQSMFAPDAKAKSVARSDNSDVLVRRDDSEEANTEANRRKKRQKETDGEGEKLIEDLKDSGDLMVTGNKSPLASSEITARDTDKEQITNEKSSEEDDYEKRVERQIQTKINSLKEEVKREIEALKQKQSSDEDNQRKKRQVVNNLVDEETDALNPVKNIDHKMKPLVRTRRSFKDEPAGNRSTTGVHHRRKKREADSSFDSDRTRRNPTDNNTEKKSLRSEDTEEGGELLDELEDAGVSKREAYMAGQEYEDLNEEEPEIDDALYERGKRSRGAPTLDFYDYDGNYLFDNERFKRQNRLAGNRVYQRRINKRFAPLRQFRLKPRLRRRINEDQELMNRPQQLSDMSDLDLFGALPKSYSGELSRYKRVKKRK